MYELVYAGTLMPEVTTIDVFVHGVTGGVVHVAYASAPVGDARRRESSSRPGLRLDLRYTATLSIRWISIGSGRKRP